tara:strand:- start:303 stop:824 length:522 start_codon:yes stop_codon:yes gene_type:complete
MTQQPYYETMYILRPDIPEEEVDSHLKKYSGILTDAGAKILDNQMRGKRRLAYPISKHKEGIYVQLSHNGDGQHVAVLEKAMRLSEDVIRYLTVKQDGPLPTPRVVSGTDSNSGKEDSKDQDSSKKKITEGKEDKKTNGKKEDKKADGKTEDKKTESKENKKDEEKIEDKKAD